MRLTTNFYDLIKEIYYKLELARFSTLLIESKTEPSVAKGGGHRTEKIYSGRGGHRTYIIEVGTLHIPYWGGDTAHSLLGWGHRTTLKEISAKFQVCCVLPSEGSPSSGW